jgi:hypothetical protein
MWGRLLITSLGLRLYCPGHNPSCPLGDERVVVHKVRKLDEATILENAATSHCLTDRHLRETCDVTSGRDVAPRETAEGARSDKRRNAVSIEDAQNGPGLVGLVVLGLYVVLARVLRASSQSFSWNGRTPNFTCPLQ